MATISVTDGLVTIAPSGVHRFAAMTKAIEFPVDAIEWVKTVEPARLIDVLQPRVTKRKKGSQIGDRYRSGAFQYWGSDDWVWLLVRKGDAAVEFSLIDHRYDRIVVAVDDPDQVVHIVDGFLSREVS